MARPGPTPADEQKMIRLYRKHTIGNVSKLTGWSQPTVVRVLKEHKVHEAYHCTPEDIAKAVKLAKQGKSLVEIFAAVGKKVSAKVLEDAGAYEIKPRCDYSNIDYAEVKRLYEDGWSWGELSRKYDAGGTMLKNKMLEHYPKVRIRTLAEQHSFDSDRRWQERRSLALTRQDFKTYKREVYRQTRLSFNKWKHVIDPKGLKDDRWAYHVDHCLSVQHAAYNYTNPLRIRLVAHPANLRVILASDNISKKDKSIYNLAQLKARIKKFETKFGPAF